MRKIALQWQGVAGKRIPASTRWAGNAWEQTRGLLFSSPMGAGESMWFPGVQSIHTMGMNRAIDVAFLSAEGEVLAVHRAVRAWRLLFGPAGASATLETECGGLDDVEPGCRVSVATIVD